jgi:hypothetical protein
MKAEKRICRPAVPLTDATLPASVLMLYVCAQAGWSITAPANARHHLDWMSFIDFSPRDALRA